MAAPLTDEEMDRMLAPAALDLPSLPAPAAPGAATGAGALVPAAAPLSDAEMDAIAASAGRGAAAGEAPGVVESFLRGALSGATFGFADEAGIADRERQEAARAANPWPNLLGEAVGSVVPMVGTGGLGAAVKGAGLAARGVRALAGAFAPGKMGTLAQAAGQGAKLGATYGGVSAAGHATGDVAERAQEGAKGAVSGALLGTGLGVGGYGASKVVGAALNRILPHLSTVRAATSAPELQGVRDALREMGYDRYTIDDLIRLRADLQDPAQAARYEGLNLIEALEARPLQPHPVTGELRPPVVTSPNLRAWAQDVANTPGAGRHQAVEAYATRRAEMPAALQSDVERLFGPPLPPKAAEAEALPSLIDAAFGSGNPAAAEAAMATRASALGKRYDALRDLPMTVSQPIALQSLPAPFQAAVKYAHDAEVMRLLANPARVQTPPKVGIGDALRNALSEPPLPRPEITRPGGEPDVVFGALFARNPEGRLQFLTPANILDIHHALVMQAKPRVGGDLVAERQATQLKNWFSRWADEQLKGHKALRTDYARFKQMMEAQEQGASLGLNQGGRNHPALEFLNGVLGQRDTAARALQGAVDRYDAAMARFNAGRIKTPPKPTQLNEGIRAVEAHNDVIAAFRRSWGEAIKDELARTGDPNSIIRPALTPEGQRRILTILGPEEGQQFLNRLLVSEARTQGAALGLGRGAADAAPLQFLDRMVREGRTEVVDTFRRAWGERINQEIANAARDNIGAVVRGLLTQEGKRRILRVLGEERGREFIESLYNKQRQLDLGQTLFGGPDTAYKLARMGKQKALMEAAHGIATLSPGRTYAALRDLGSAAWQQRRADLSNQLLAVQGREDVGRVIDALIARNRLAHTGDPFTVTPGRYVIGPYVGTQMGYLTAPPAVPSQGRAEYRRALPAPYRAASGEMPALVPYRP